MNGGGMSTSGKETVAKEPCPRCGCWVVMDFTCGCGRCKDDYCLNCGRFGALPRNKHTEMAGYDARCEHGPVLHAHSEKEKSKRINDWYKALRRKIAAETK
jgi:hypothetical protein